MIVEAGRLQIQPWARRSGTQGVLLVGAFFYLFTPERVNAQEVRFLYDAKGQLVGTIDSDGSAATFVLDENGNLVAVSRTLANSLPGNVGLTLVSPNQGKATNGTWATL